MKRILTTAWSKKTLLYCAAVVKQWTVLILYSILFRKIFQNVRFLNLSLQLRKCSIFKVTVGNWILPMRGNRNKVKLLHLWLVKKEFDITCHFNILHQSFTIPPQEVANGSFLNLTNNLLNGTYTAIMFLLSYDIMFNV